MPNTIGHFRPSKDFGVTVKKKKKKKENDQVILNVRIF